MNTKDSKMKMKPSLAGVSSPVKSSSGVGAFEAAGGLEIRPGGMLVQQRNSDINQNTNLVPNIKVKVKYGSFYHEVTISSQASFGELKKLLSGPTGLHLQDQKLIFKEKEKVSKAFLDFSGVKNGSKIVLIEDELSKEKRCIEARKSAKMQKASQDIKAIRFEIDDLAKQVASIEFEIKGGKKVVETILSTMIELLMTQLIKLDGIDADGDVKLQRRMQVKRVQKCIETLDALKIRNSEIDKLASKGPIMFQNRQDHQKHGNFNERMNPRSVVVTTKWETF